MKLHTINHGSGTMAKMLTTLDGEAAEHSFNELADKCFGLRKSNFGAHIIATEEVGDAAVVIQHNGGDLIIFDTEGKKIKDEWDDWGHEALNSKKGE